MKFYSIVLILILTTSAFASTKHTCVYGGYDLKIVTQKSNDIALEVFKGKNKLMGCNFKVVSYDDGKTSASTDELMSFEKIGCNLIYDQVASKVIVSEKGFVKISSKGKSSYAYIIKNEQPLKCKIK